MKTKHPNRFVRIILDNGTFYYINIDIILYVHKTMDGKNRIYVKDDTNFYVKESPEEIMKQIEGYYEI